MILYDWKKVRRKTGTNAWRIFRAMKVLSGEIPQNKYDYLYSYYVRDFSGDSYMLNLKDLVDLSTPYTLKERAEYFVLASYRNRALLKTFGDATLPLEHSPISQTVIKQNRLLRVIDNRILFKYEEKSLGDKSKWL